MKKIFVAIAFFVAAIGTAQQNIKQSDDNLYTLGKVWGLLKYYHPEVSAGKTDADSLLLASVATNEKASDIINRWINYIDRKPAVTNPVLQKDCTDADNRNTSFAWIKADRNLTAKQKKYFTALTANTNIGTYYSRKEDSPRYSGHNEKLYKDKTADESYRLLNLFRAWNVIEYYYPYKYMNSQGWDKVLSGFIPQFRKAGAPVDYYKTIMLFAAAIEDTHAETTPQLYKPIFGKYGPPFTFQVAEGKIVVTKLIDPKNTAVLPSDIIEKIDGSTISDIIKDKSRYIAASNETVKTRDAYNYLMRGKEGSFTIEGRDRDDKPFTRTIERIDRSSDVWFKDGIPDNPLVSYDEKTQKTVYYTVTDKNIGYIDFSLADPADIETIMATMKNTKGIVFDLRGYNDNGGLLKIFDYLLPQPKWFGISSQPDFTKPGRFCYDDYIIDKRLKYIGKDNPGYYKGKVAVLVNEYTQSAEEMWAMIFKTIPNVTVIGSQTAGADGNQTPIPLIDGMEILFSGTGIFYPDKTETQKIGIVPDIIVRPSVKDIRANTDVLVQKAFEVILK